jgi:hypothetical protein
MAESTARQLSSGLAPQAVIPTVEQRREEQRSLHLTIEPGKAPSVRFEGFWSGKFVTAAQASIAKAYRMLKYKPSRPTGSNLQGAKNLEVK